MMVRLSVLAARRGLPPEVIIALSVRAGRQRVAAVFADGVYRCTGEVVDRNWVLTSGDCAALVQSVATAEVAAGPYWSVLLVDHADDLPWRSRCGDVAAVLHHIAAVPRGQGEVVYTGRIVSPT